MVVGVRILNRKLVASLSSASASPGLDTPFLHTDPYLHPYLPPTRQLDFDLLVNLKS